MSTHQELFTSFRRGIYHSSWKKFCATLFGFNSELIWRRCTFKLAGDSDDYLTYPLPSDSDLDWFITPIARNEDFKKTKRFLPEPILSYRLANVAILCMQYLHRLDLNTLLTNYHFLTNWAARSKKLPWLWRRRMRVTSMKRRRPIRKHDGHKYSFSQNLGRPYQIIYSEMIQLHQEQRLIYTWTLDLLYHTLRKAMKSDELTRALSKPFIPSLAPVLFPRGIKRVRKAARAYLENVSRRFLV